MLTTAPPLPLVFFPGAGGRVEFLRPIAERLAHRRETRICEYPGLGGVAPAPALGSLDDLKAYLLADLPAQFDLVTMSMGGVLGVRIALEHPQRIRKLVLMATSGGVDVASLGALDWRDKFQSVQPERPSWFVDDRTNVSSELGRIPHPTLLVFGDDDLIAPPAIGQFLAERLPHARLEIVAGGTHDLEIEYPDLIASMIEAHLRRPG